MIGERYWTTGITCMWHGNDQWSVSLEFLDDGFVNQDSTDGTLRKRYIDDLSYGIDRLIADANKLNIEWRRKNLYVKGDGEDNDYPLPKNWKKIISKEAKRVGFESPY